MVTHMDTHTPTQGTGEIYYLEVEEDKDIITMGSTIGIPKIIITIMDIIIMAITRESQHPEEPHPDMGLLGVVYDLEHPCRADMWSLKDFYRTLLSKV